jgi:hypothetical protein
MTRFTQARVGRRGEEEWQPTLFADLTRSEGSRAPLPPLASHQFQWQWHSGRARRVAGQAGRSPFGGCALCFTYVEGWAGDRRASLLARHLRPACVEVFAMDGDDQFIPTAWFSVRRAACGRLAGRAFGALVEIGKRTSSIVLTSS